jgi:hypothetical protein
MLKEYLRRTSIAEAIKKNHEIKQAAKKQKLGEEERVQNLKKSTEREIVVIVPASDLENPEVPAFEEKSQRNLR